MTTTAAAVRMHRKITREGFMVILGRRRRDKRRFDANGLARRVGSVLVQEIQEYSRSQYIGLQPAVNEDHIFDRFLQAVT